MKRGFYYIDSSLSLKTGCKNYATFFYLLLLLNIVTCVWYLHHLKWQEIKINSGLKSHNTSINSFAIYSSPDCKMFSKGKNDVIMNLQIMAKQCFAHGMVFRWNHWKHDAHWKSITVCWLQLLQKSFNNTFIFDRNYFPWKSDFKFFAENKWNFSI